MLNTEPLDTSFIASPRWKLNNKHKWVNKTGFIYTKINTRNAKSSQNKRRSCNNSTGRQRPDDVKGVIHRLTNSALNITGLNIV